jgi:hypothetical protein
MLLLGQGNDVRDERQPRVEGDPRLRLVRFRVGIA